MIVEWCNIHQGDLSKGLRMRELKILTMLAAFMLLVAFCPLVTSDSTQPPLEMKPQASVIILPHDVYLVFSTRKNAQHEYPDPFRAIEVDGHILLGYTFLCGDKENGGDKKRTTILVMVDNPEMYTRTYVERLAKLLYVINTLGYDITKLDLL